ncbi:MAG: hypothetical protein LUD47_05605 [Clostridia bacterium]|nr:hypothetical protein [Clostridia bacterium]
MKKKIAGLSAFVFVVLFAVIAVFGFTACSYDDAKEVTKFGDNNSSSGSGSTPIMRVFVPDLSDDDDAAAMALGDGYFAGCDFTVTQTVNGDGEAVYLIDGTSSQMTEEIAGWFGAGAQEGDDYVTLKIYVPEGSTISFVSHGEEYKSYTNEEDADANQFDGDYLFLVFRLTGVYASDESEITPPDMYEFTVTWTETVEREQIIYEQDEEGKYIATGEVEIYTEDVDMEETFYVSFTDIALAGEAGEEPEGESEGSGPEGDGNVNE